MKWKSRKEAGTKERRMRERGGGSKEAKEKGEK